jgi:hypothetical protein
VNKLNFAVLAATVTCAVTALAPAANAVFITPVSAVASSSYPGWAASNAIDNALHTDWAANSTGVGSYLDLDLGTSATWAKIFVRDRTTSGHSNGTGPGWLVDFTTSARITVYDSTFTIAGASYDISHTSPTLGCGLECDGTPDTGFEFTDDLTGISGQYLRYTVLTMNSDKYNNPGLDAIAFEAKAVPEPASLALLASGLLAAGAARRKRKAKA